MLKLARPNVAVKDAGWVTPNATSVTESPFRLTYRYSALTVQRNDIARTLIAAGADVNAKADNDVRPLHTAAARGNLEAVALLLDHGADINAASKDGKTAFTYAEERNHPDMVQFLNSKLK